MRVVCVASSSEEIDRDHINLIRAGLGGCNIHNHNLMEQVNNMEADIVRITEDLGLNDGVGGILETEAEEFGDTEAGKDDLSDGEVERKD